MPPAWSVARSVEGTALLEAASPFTPKRSRTVRSYCALLRRGICEVAGTPWVHVVVPVPAPVPPEAVVPVPPVVLVPPLLLVEPPLPVEALPPVPVALVGARIPLLRPIHHPACP